MREVMSQEAPKSVCPHIVIAGRINAGKSALINALCGQEIAIVSSHPGTTTDPVEKKMELLPLGTVLLIDTAGLDDMGDTGILRIKRSREMLTRADLVILVTDGDKWDDFEKDLFRQIEREEIPCIIAINDKDRKLEACKELLDRLMTQENKCAVIISPVSGLGIQKLKNLIMQRLKEENDEKRKIFSDLVPEGPILLIVPIDSGAPKGRLILPQVQTIRECLDENRTCVIITEKQLNNYKDYLSCEPALVICDSQIIQLAANKIPTHIPLTTFSILMARYKGDLQKFAQGAKKLSLLKKDARILIMEACTHHPQADDIGRKKIPALLKKIAGEDLDIHFFAGRNMPPEDEHWDLIIHCGGCMLSPRQMRMRQKWAHDRGIPMSNYGMTISHAQGVLDRSMAIFGEAE